MKKIIILCGIFLTIMLRANDTVTTYFRDISAEFSWLRLGKIESITIERNGIRTCVFAYRNDQNVHFLNGSLQNINCMINSEIRTNIADFIKTDIGNLFSYFLLSTGEDILDKNYLRSYVAQFAKTDEKKLDSNVRLMEHYCTGISTEIKNNIWKVIFNAIGRDGKIKIWEYRGIVDPFSITELSIRVGNKGRPLPVITYVGKP